MKKICPTGHVKKKWIFSNFRGEGGGGLRQSWKIPTFFFEPFPNSITKKKEIALKKLEKVFEKIGKKHPFILVKADNLPQKWPGFNPHI